MVCEAPAKRWNIYSMNGLTDLSERRFLHFRPGFLEQEDVTLMRCPAHVRFEECGLQEGVAYLILSLPSYPLKIKLGRACTFPTTNKVLEILFLETIF